ncbi:MAG: hypothetical protein IH989_03640 [Planctomycetes bacterium]|nr:hypothetical protein [Planctomycetota bacterium]
MPGAPARTIHADLRLRAGGGLSGPVVDSTDHGLVVVHDLTPYVFAWEELEPDSAYETKGALLALARGGKDRMTGEDYFRLGLFAYRHGLGDRAGNCFSRATRLDATYRSRVNSAVAEWELHEDGVVGLDAATKAGPALAENEPAIDPPRDGPATSLAPGPLVGRRGEVRQAYDTFGAKVKEVMGKDVTLVETDHFLIWTDWRRGRDRLGLWCEAMYAALCEQFGLSPADDIFLAKCPIYCWRSKARFQRFARHFDGFEGSGAVGYTRSIAENGHVHVVLLRQGNSPADLDRFACTLVHEGTHAFLHRLHSSALIPHWVNEGYADLVAERVLGDRCPAGENAALLARQIVRFDWPLGDLLSRTGPIKVHQYPIAHSVVSFLERKNRGRFAGFIRALKEGQSIEAALDAHYGIPTVDRLETQWRRSIRANDVP